MKLSSSFAIAFNGLIATLLPIVTAGILTPSYTPRLNAGKSKQQGSIKSNHHLSSHTAPLHDVEQDYTDVEIQIASEHQEEKWQDGSPAEKPQEIDYRLQCEEYHQRFCEEKHGSYCDEYGNLMEGSRWCQEHCTCEPHRSSTYPTIVNPLSGGGIHLYTDPLKVPPSRPRFKSKHEDAVPEEKKDQAEGSTDGQDDTTQDVELHGEDTKQAAQRQSSQPYLRCDDGMASSCRRQHGSFAQRLVFMSRIRNGAAVIASARSRIKAMNICPQLSSLSCAGPAICLGAWKMWIQGRRT